MFHSVLRNARLAAIAACALIVVASGARAGSPVEDADFLDALTWGVTPSSYEELRVMGRERWLKEQLAPPAQSRIPDALRARIEALRPTDSLTERLISIRAQKAEIRDIMDVDVRLRAKRKSRQGINAIGGRAVQATLLQALYSKDQLRERLVWFWYNHFNVHKSEPLPSAALGEYVDKAIRPHVLGRFHDLLMATVRQPAMLHYLDNFKNWANRRNENYAREIMELHTMGVGSGYSQADVEALTRILTGVGTVWNLRKRQRLTEAADAVGEDGFAFHTRFHDYGDKVFLGKRIRGRGWPEVEEALRMISAHPATARHIARSLALYFMGGVEPSDALVEQLAKVFTTSDGTIATVVDTLFHSEEFEGSLDKQFKDPTRFVLSALRLAYEDREIQDTKPVEQWLAKLGQGMFARSTPDGYPLEPKAWSSPGQLLARFEVAGQIGSGSPNLFVAGASETTRTADAVPDEAETPGTPAPDLEDEFYAATFSKVLSQTTRDTLKKAKSRADWNTLFLSSPEFMK